MRQRRKSIQLSQVLPTWTPTHSATANLASQAVFQKLGVTDLSSYWQKMQGAIVLSAIVCACIGASVYGLIGFLLGGLLGIGAPAAAIFLAVVAVLMAFSLGIFCAAWLAIYYIACWLLGS